MVKRQKEKQYQSAREQREYGQARAGNDASNRNALGTVQKTLPFACCALTLTPFQQPSCIVVTANGTNNNSSSSNQNKVKKYGIVFDNVALMEFVLKHKKDPVSGKSISSNDIITLHMDQDSETGQWQCPVLNKALTDHTKTVAILTKNKKDAYVYSLEAYNELNVKPKQYLDLTTGDKFHPQNDVLFLNDPDDKELQNRRDISSFWHIQFNRNNEVNSAAASSNNNDNNIQKSVTATRIMEQLEKDRRHKRNEEEEQNKKKQKTMSTDSAPAAAAAAAAAAPSVTSSSQHRPYRVLAKDVTGIQYTEGKTSSSFTSTSMEIQNQNDDREATQEEILRSILRLVKKNRKGEKGYVKMTIRIGNEKKEDNNNERVYHDNDDDNKMPSSTLIDILLELHCDIVPRTCMNFLGLCRAGKYDGTIFHRYIPNFMMQGGSNKYNIDEKDKSSSATIVDCSLWGPNEYFYDEFDDRLKHNEAGILSMANSGPKTNLQQFFITFQPCTHLDRKHSVFGQVVDGMDRLVMTLENVHHVKTDKKNRPNIPIHIMSTEIIVDPIREVEEQEEERLAALAAARKRGSSDTSKFASINKKGDDISGTKIGKYLPSSCFLTNDIIKSNSEDEQSISTSTHIRKDKTTATSLPTKQQFGDFRSWL